MTGNLFPERLRASHQEKRPNNNFRRNGKLQACEPCRKGKMRCDHMVPTCGRCSRLNRAERCVYHPAPMTKATSVAASCSPESDESTSSLNSFSTIYSLNKRPVMSQAPSNSDLSTTTNDSFQPRRNADTISAPETANAQVSSHRVTRARTSRVDSVAPQSLSFLSQSLDEICQPLPDNRLRIDALSFDNRAGLTNNAALLNENEADIGISDSWSNTDRSPRITQMQIDRGAAVLMLLQDIPAVQKYIDKLFSFAAGIVVIEPMVKIYLDGIYSSWHKVLEASQPNTLRFMSEMIWENTLVPVSGLLSRNTPAREFCRSVTGEALRWEIVGIIFSLISLLCQSLRGKNVQVFFVSHQCFQYLMLTTDFNPYRLNIIDPTLNGDPIFCSKGEAPVDRAKLALKMLNASEMCVGICDDLGALNDLYLWLLYENSIAYCSMRTKGSYENGKKMSRLTTALVSCNLHQEISTDEDTPLFIAEIRKRLFVCVYELDKTSAACTGRPPRLTRHYCRLQIPLDLTDAQTMSDDLDVTCVAGNLDQSGWNASGLVQGCTVARVSAANAIILEETLEISLGNMQPDEVVKRVQEIQAKANNFWMELPGFLRLDLVDPLKPTRPPLELFVLCFIRLSHLNHQFLLQRTLTKKTEQVAEESKTNLLNICSEMFAAVMLMVDNSHIFTDFQIDFNQILVKHGIPAGAVLAIEMLQQEQNSSVPSFPLHRSDMIQKLSVLVSCLGTVKPEANGAFCCYRGRRFFKKILDTILGAGSAAEQNSATASDSAEAAVGISMFEPGNDVDFVQWIDNMAWDADNWMQFS